MLDVVDTPISLRCYARVFAYVVLAARHSTSAERSTEITVRKNAVQTTWNHVTIGSG